MGFKEITNKRYAGFFDYEEGNIIQGSIEEENITGTNDSGSETGYIAIKLTEPCKAKLDDVAFDANVGDVIAISITNATRVLIGLKRAALVRCTFLGFKSNKRNTAKRYHCWKIEVNEDDES